MNTACRTGILCVLAALLAGCATHPSRIQPRLYTRPLPPMDCTLLDSTLLQDKIDLAIHTGRQKVWARGDVTHTTIGSVGAIALIPLIAFAWLQGNGEDAEKVAFLKGRVAALEEEFAGRCNPSAP